MTTQNTTAIDVYNDLLHYATDNFIGKHAAYYDERLTALHTAYGYPTHKYNLSAQVQRIENENPDGPQLYTEGKGANYQFSPKGLTEQASELIIQTQEESDLNRTAIDMINAGLQKAYKQLLVLQEDVITFPATTDNTQEIIDIETRLANIIQTIRGIM